MMKPGLASIVGKRIQAVLVAEARRAPYQRVFLTFTDGTCFEFYGENFSCCSGLDDAMKVLWYIESGDGKIVQSYSAPEDRMPWHGDPSAIDLRMLTGHVAPDEHPIFATRRETEAWEAAKAVIGKARTTSD